MRQFTLILILIGLLVLSAVALVLRHGLAGLEAQHRLNHRLLAERVIDECERELDALLRKEEGRSFADYRYFVIPPHQAPGSIGISCSPLVVEPVPDYVLGYYQREPDGRLGSPAVPENRELAIEVFGYRPRDRDERLLARAAGWFEAAALPVVEAAAPRSREREPVVVVETEMQSSLFPIGKTSLNRGFGNRVDRSSKSLKVSSSSVYNYTVDEDENLLQQQVLANVQAVQEGEAGAELRLREIHDSVRRALPGADADGVDVRVEPLRGRVSGDGAVLLERVVVIGQQRYRQGLALDPAALCAAIEGAVMAGSELAPQVALHWSHPDAEATTPPTAPFSFAYRFAEPFTALGLRVDLQPVPGQRPPGRSWLLGLGLGVLGVVALGLLALQRMVAARIAYARRRSDFVSAVTHELKTPLTSIRMYGEMLGSEMGEAPAARERYAGIITAEGERLSRLIDNVLELARLERDDRPMAVSVGDPCELLQAALAICAPHARRHGFALDLACPEGLPACRCDHDALTQVVVNLVDNAVKFAAGSEPRTILLSARSHASELVLAVRDFGPGVPETQLRQICQPFFRGERELTRRTRGTGIGLALVHSLVIRMGGRLALANHPEGGFVAEIHLATATPA